MTIKILIADDHQIMRQGLKSLLEKQGDLQVIGEAENGREVMKMVRELSPDIIVMDISMPDLNGIDATRRIVAEFPNTKIVALSIHSDRRFVAQMIEAGATGYILKENAFEELAKAIRVVNNNQTFLCPKIASIVTTSAGAFALSIFSWIFPLPCCGEIGLSLSSFEHPQKTNALNKNVKIKFFISGPLC